MSEENCLTLISIVLFEVIVVISTCPDFSVVNMEYLSSDLKALWQVTERNWSISLSTIMEYLCLEATEKEAKGRIMVESSN